MNKIPLPNYNLHWTLMGGQSHNWEFENGHYYGFTTRRILKLKQVGDELFWQTFPIKNDFEFLEKYLNLDIDYQKIIKTINKDMYIKKAMKTYPNLWLLKQNFEEVLLSYLFSATNNLKSIRNSIKKLREMYGEKIRIDGKDKFLFPETVRISNAKIEDLLKTRMGFRSKYLKSAAERIVQEKTSEKIQNLSENHSRKMLLAFEGVGEKIADCVLVYGLGFNNVTPLDIWGKRFAEKYYHLSSKLKYTEIRSWLSDYFEGYAGWAGQFLYEYIRNHGKEKKLTL
ncbi:MAG TPA: DNA glycosylase [Candidatus Dojkabacteria bacterium]